MYIFYSIWFVYPGRISRLRDRFLPFVSSGSQEIDYTKIKLMEKDIWCTNQNGLITSQYTHTAALTASTNCIPWNILTHCGQACLKIDFYSDNFKQRGPQMANPPSELNVCAFKPSTT